MEGQRVHTGRTSDTATVGGMLQLEAVFVRITLVFSTASSILSTMAVSSTCSSHDVLLTELTG